MTSGSTIAAERRPLTGLSRARGWQLWHARRPALVLVVIVELATVVAIALGVSTLQIESVNVVRSVLILGLAIAYLESSVRLARMRRYLRTTARVNMVAVWIVASILTVPIAYVSVIVPVLLAYEILRGGDTGQTYRSIFAASSQALAGIAACGVFGLLRPDEITRYGGTQALAIIAAVVVYAAITAVLALVSRYDTLAPGTRRALLPGREEQALEIATVVMGVLAGQLISSTTFLTPIVLVLMGLLQRSAMVSQLQVAATTDAKTGLLNAAAWQELAQRELLRAQRDQAPGAVLLLDLDHFKRLNDTLGHLRGDVALKAVADALKRELRGYDAVARFGGEEFVVFLNDLPVTGAAVVAERVLTRIRNLSITGAEGGSDRYRMTASIGLACYPEQGDTLVELLEAADLALYSAKNNGRDQVGQPRNSRSADPRQPVKPDEVDTPRAREAS